MILQNIQKHSSGGCCFYCCSPKPEGTKLNDNTVETFSGVLRYLNVDLLLTGMTLSSAKLEKQSVDLLSRTFSQILGSCTS